MYKVYWTLIPSKEVHSVEIDDLQEALLHTKTLRATSHCQYVAMVAENPDQVGKMGVDSVVDGKLPSGEDYTWKMRRI